MISNECIELFLERIELISNGGAVYGHYNNIHFYVSEDINKTLDEHYELIKFYINTFEILSTKVFPIIQREIEIKKILEC